MRTKRLKYNAVRTAFSVLVIGFVGACSTSYSYEPVYELNGERQPLLAEDFYRRGVEQLRANRIGLALHDLRRALASAPTSVATLNAIAISYDELQRYDVSRQYYDRCLMLEPDSVQTLNNLARSLLRQGEAEEALAYLERARSLAKENETILDNLAFAERQLDGRVEMADGRIPGHSLSPSPLKTPASTTWIERTSRAVQTLVTSAVSDLVGAAGDAALKPGDVTFHGFDTSALDGRTIGADLVQRGVEPSRVRVLSQPGTSDRLGQLAAAKGQVSFDGYPAAPPGTFVEEPLQEMRSTGAVAMAAVEEPPVPPPFQAGGVTIEPVESEPLASLDYLQDAQGAALPATADPTFPPRATGETAELDFVLEISNGAGRRHMAARMSRYLEQRGLPQARLTNASSFSHQESTVFFRPGYESAALQVAASLPVPVLLQEQPDQHQDVRLMLGGDLLEFDGTFLLATKGY